MVSDKIKKIMSERKITSKQLAEHLGIKAQSLANRFVRDTWSVQDLIIILDYLDCQLVIEEKPNTKYIFSIDDIKNYDIKNTK